VCVCVRTGMRVCACVCACVCMRCEAFKHKHMPLYVLFPSNINTCSHSHLNMPIKGVLARLYTYVYTCMYIYLYIYVGGMCWIRVTRIGACVCIERPLHTNLHTHLGKKDEDMPLYMQYSHAHLHLSENEYFLLVLREERRPSSPACAFK